MNHFGDFEDKIGSNMENFLGNFDSDSSIFFEKFDLKGRWRSGNYPL